MASIASSTATRQRPILEYPASSSGSKPRPIPPEYAMAAASTSTAGPSTSAGPSASYSHSNKTAGQTLNEFAAQLDDYTPTIPDSVVTYIMQTAGLSTNDPRTTRLISIAAQKFVSDIANDALQHCKMRGAGQTKKAAKDKRYTLTMEDLVPALKEYGINAKKPNYYA